MGSALRSILAFGFIFIVSTSFAQTYYRFIENKGQYPEEVKYSVEIENGMIFFESDRFTYSLNHPDDLKRIGEYHSKEVKSPDLKVRSHAYSVSFSNSSTDDLIGKTILKGITSYFKGSNPENWASGCRGYEEILYKDLYPSIDLRVYSNDFLLKFEYIVGPNADISLIEQAYEGVDGLKLSSGRVVVRTSAGDMIEERPVSFQKSSNGNHLVRSKYVKSDNTISYEFPDGYDNDRALIIDPELIFSTYSGSTTDNFGYTAAFDADGFLYSGSSAFGTGYPTTLGSFEQDWGTGVVDIALSKVDTTGTFFVWSAYLGGTDDELPHSIMVNEEGELYVLGSSSSQDFPVTAGSAYDTDYNGGGSIALAGLGVNYNNGSDIVVSRISADGSQLLGSTYVGGSDNDGLNYGTPLKYNYADEIRGEIQLDDDGNVFVVSSTYSTDFPVSLNAAQTGNNGEQEAVAFMMSPDLSNLEWSTYLGGSSNDAGYSLTFDDLGNVIVCGGTQSTDFPFTANAIQNSYAGGDADGFFTRITSSGQIIDYSTFYGSDQYDQLYFTETDETDQVYVFGQTEHSGSDFIFNAAYNTVGGGQIISKFNDSMESLEWSTAFGTGDGQPNISPTAFLVDVCDRIYLSGWGGPTGGGGLGVSGMDVTSDAYKNTSVSGDFYLMVLFDDASDIFYGSYYGGDSSSEHVDGGTSRFNRKGQVYQAVCAGCGSNDDFPIEPSNAISPTNNSFNCNLGIFKFDFQLPLTIADFVVSDQICVNQEFTVDNQSTFSQTFEWDFGDGSELQFGPNPSHTYSSPGTYEITLTVTSNETCNAADSITKVVTIDFNNTTTAEEVVVCAGESVQIGVETDPNNEYMWSPDDYLSESDVSDPISTPFSDIDYVLTIQRGACVDTLFQHVEVEELGVEIPDDVTLCDGGVVDLEVITDQALEISWSLSSDFNPLLNDNTSDYDISVPVAETSIFYVQAAGELCTENYEVNVLVIADFVELQDDVSICAGDTITVSVLNSLPEIEYSWSPNAPIISGQGTSEVTITTDDILDLTVSATQDGCDVEDTMTIGVINSSNSGLIATASPSSILLGQSSQLSVNLGGLEYTWLPDASLDNSSIQSPLATPNQTTTYTVTAGQEECAQNSQVTVTVVDFVCGDPTIFVPNAFSPNGDGENDVLYVYGQNELFPLELTFRVYNRWGQKVFETFDFDNGWDGVFNGKLSDPAVFDYYLEVFCEGGEEYFEKGNITLVR